MFLTRMRCRLVGTTVLIATFALVAPAQGATASTPAPLSADGTMPNVPSTYGSGVFGIWTVDAFGLPAYRYTMDEQADPRAHQSDLDGSTDAWSQVGNERVKADAFNHGYTQVWSQDRLAQWTNLYDAAHGHYSGGFGYLNVNGATLSTLYDDRPNGAGTTRTFGVGYFSHSLTTNGVAVHDSVYAPFGNDPLLVHDVNISNTSEHTEHVSWFEYWDANPYVPSSVEYRGMRSPTWDASSQTIQVRQLPMAGDTQPLSLFAAQIGGHTTAYATTQDAFFGSGTRSRPEAVVNDRLPDNVAPAVPNGTEGTTLFAMQSTEELAPGHSVTLRYVYGYGHPAQIPGLVAKYRHAAHPFTTSEQSWASSLPKLSIGGLPWLGREFLWDAYLLRSAAVDEEDCGVHTITQGGYYQYEVGQNLGTRSWLHYLLPMSYMDPQLAREILIYAAQFQQQSTGQLPYGSTALCQAFNLGQSDDLDFWLLLAGSQYALATRDVSFFSRQVHFYDSKATASLWNHLKLAFAHQQSLLGPHGEYYALSLGDWSDELPANSGMTESTLVVAQCAYAFPQLEEVAKMRGDYAFAGQLQSAAADLLTVLRSQWTGGGWFSRGYAGQQQIGQGVIFLEPQPWAILAGAPTISQTETLIANIRRFLDGVGAPSFLGGPDLIGTSLGPARDDPGITETTSLGGGQGIGSNNAVWPGGTWFDPDGWLTWAYASLGEELPDASELAMSEWMRTTLANHAAAFPDQWDGITSVDDTCSSFYSLDPSGCGGVFTGYEGQISEQPTWMIMDAIDIAGITPTATGYQISPQFPGSSYSLRLETIGVARQGRVLRGYVRPLSGGVLRMQVSVPRGAKHVLAWVDSSPVHVSIVSGLAEFKCRTSADRATDWAVTWT
jgi:hypothetical protein